jgi:polysaccharide export outer membrane protein
MNINFLFFPAIAVCLFSCRSVPKDVAYFQDFDAYLQTVRPESSAAYDAVIKKNDQLMISVSAPVLDQAQVAQFNLPVNVYLSPGELTTTQSMALQTYAVDMEGCINFPVVGKIRLAGLTRMQAVDLVAQKVSAYLPDPVINFQMLSYKVTVIGEVTKPGQVNVNDGRISIFEALGAAGDLTIHGDRRNVMLIRETAGGKEYYRFDLTASAIFDSPYYYLQQNDVLYVSPNNTRKLESRLGLVDNYRLSVISTTLGALSILTSTIVTIISLSK